MTSFYSRFCQLLCRFRRERKGNVAITFAIACIPLIGFVGAAVDYSHANKVKASLQSALDSTALMMSKVAPDLSDVSTNGQPSALDTKAQAYFDALFNGGDATVTSLDASYTTTGGTSVTVSGSAQVPTTFLNVLGFHDITVGGSSTVTWGSTRLRVALVLDNTGSMRSSGKLTALKTATKNLLSQLKGAATNDGDVYVSIIPFVKDVAVDTTDYDSSWENWIDWSLTQPTHSDGSVNAPSSDVGPGSACPYSSRSDGYNCVTSPGGRYSTWTVPSSGTYAGDICPSNSIGCYDSVANGTTTTTKTVSTGWWASCGNLSSCTCTGTGYSKVCTQTVTATAYKHTWFVDPTKWDGCVTDRGDVAPGSNDGPDQYYYDPNGTSALYTTKIPAENYSACPEPMMGLNYNWSAMNTMVDNMVANGSTNQPIGLVWGWQSLVGGGPFTAPAMDANYKYQQIIILLSDGLNTQDRWYGNGYNTSTAVDNRMYQTGNGAGTCANFKNASTSNVTNVIYTIQVDTGGDPTSTLLKNCASDSSKFFLLTSADQIVTAFNQIGTDITRLRVSK